MNTSVLPRDLAASRVVASFDADTPRAQRHAFAPHDVIFFEGDPANRVYELGEGALMLYKLLPDGRRQVVEIVAAGDLFGLDDGDIHECSAEALTPVVVLSYDRGHVERSPEFQRRLAACMRVKLSSLHEHAVLLGRKSALERVASFIMRLVPNRGGYHCVGRAGEADPAQVRLTMTRQEIADYLGLTIETVSRAFSELKRRGLVVAIRQDELRIVDVCGMCRLTGAH